MLHQDRVHTPWSEITDDMHADTQARFVESHARVCILCAYLCHCESEWKEIHDYPWAETDL